MYEHTLRRISIEEKTSALFEASEAVHPTGGKLELKTSDHVRVMEVHVSVPLRRVDVERVRTIHSSGMLYMNPTMK